MILSILLPVLFDLVVKIGIPALIEWIKSKFPRFSGVAKTVAPVMQQYLDDLASGMSKREARRKAKLKFKEHCEGQFCPSDVKDL